jgi:hypothetical protein
MSEFQNIFFQKAEICANLKIGLDLNRKNCYFEPRGGRGPAANSRRGAAGQ